jgi:hypothetical protein
MCVRRVAIALSMAGVMTLGCGGITTPSNNQTEPFSGTLQPRGSNPHAFNVSKTGEFSAKLTAWGPNTNLLVGLAWTIGNNDGSCSTSVLQQNNFVALNAQGLFGSIVAGKYCIFVFDVGTLTANQTYTVTVSHP